MNPSREHDAASRAEDFDRRLRELHAEAVAQVPGPTLLRLQSRRARHAGNRTRHPVAWPMAVSCAICLVVAGAWLRYPHGGAPSASISASQTGDNGAELYDALDESPEFYEWLASNDTEKLITE